MAAGILSMAQEGTVYLVGAGPGRPDLITVRGLDLLRTADCIVCDGLVHPGLLAHARADAQVIHVPKRVGDASVSQDRINDLIVQQALQGRSVVRLKGGDPTIFGRAAEELAAVVEAGLPFEVVPGVTAALGASAYSGILLTDRASCSQVALVTGHEAPDKTGPSLDWAALARFRGTLVFYMGVASLRPITERLAAGGMDADTPCAVVCDATLPTQRVVRDRLCRLADRCQQEGVEPPAVVLVGPCACADERLGWFARLPLFGRTVVVTRDARGNAESARQIMAHGGRVLAFDTVVLRPLPFPKEASDLTGYDWVVFSSPNGVEFFMAALDRMGRDARALGRASIAALGPATAERLRASGIRADLVPEVFTSRDLGRQLIERAGVRGRSVLLLRSGLADHGLMDDLAEAGACVDQAAVYTAEPVRGDASGLLEEIRLGKVQWLTFASASEARAFFDQVPAACLAEGRVRVASIGPVTSRQLRDLGVRVDAEARDHTIQGLIRAMIGERG
ncbi:MAG: uroporphyrinogen-III C-methyltransferase [Phycisphaerae bacterium]|nr:uroporphyrinogen-III C-methyltransferase [Phycisphaerae bacterium]